MDKKQKYRYFESEKSKDSSAYPHHARYSCLETKLDIICRCFEKGEDVLSVSIDTGYSRTCIYLQRRIYLGRLGSMDKDINDIEKVKFII